jgi:hypothetical protein
MIECALSQTKFVTRGKKRIASVGDNGQLRAIVAFAAGETKVTLSSYAPSSPKAQTVTGAVSNVTFDAATHLFTLDVSPDKSGTAAVVWAWQPARSRKSDSSLSQRTFESLL